MVDFCSQRIQNRPLGTDDAAAYSRIGRWIGIGVLLMAPLLTYAWVQMESLSIHYQMEELKRQNVQFREKNTALRTEHSALVNPDRIDREARRLGLVRSNSPRVTILYSEDSDSTSPAQNLVARFRLLDRGRH